MIVWTSWGWLDLIKRTHAHLTKHTIKNNWNNILLHYLSNRPVARLFVWGGGRGGGSFFANCGTFYDSLLLVLRAPSIWSWQSTYICLISGNFLHLYCTWTVIMCVWGPRRATIITPTCDKKWHVGLHLCQGYISVISHFHAALKQHIHG